MIERLRGWAAESGAAGPATADALAAAEGALGFALPPTLRRVYAEVSSAGAGPGSALPLAGGSASLVGTYALFREGRWPDRLLPVWDWGDAIWSCVDARDRAVTSEASTLTLTDFTVATWLEAWLDGVDLWSELFADREATILDPFTRTPVVTRVRGVALGRPWPPPEG